MDIFSTDKSKWIAMDAKNGGTDGAPYFFSEFYLEDTRGVSVTYSFLGFGELYINGRQISERRLDPVISPYDKLVRCVTQDLSKHLKRGKNTIGVILGNGMFNASTKVAWNFQYASWKSIPRFRLEICDREKRVIKGSDVEWKTSPGPIIFNQLRSGEHYDARKEIPGWEEGAPDTKTWSNAIIVTPPGGELVKQRQAPCRTLNVFSLNACCMKNCEPGMRIYDLKRSIAGHARIKVKGARGTKIRLTYSEEIAVLDGFVSLQRDKIKGLVYDEFQIDEYVLKGDEEGETFEPRFVYHGFSYLGVSVCDGLPENVEILDICAVEVGTYFSKKGFFYSSLPVLNALQKLTLQSFRANFVGIPTDCPHREKNGWTGDAALAVDTGLYNFRAEKAYKEWIDSMRASQLPGGAVPCIVPAASFGYDWGTGPGWDSALFIIPYSVYLHSGDKDILRKNYPAMEKYLNYCQEVTKDGVVQWGLGDWCPPSNCSGDFVDTPSELVTTALYYECVRIAWRISEILGKNDKAGLYKEKMSAIKDSFNKAFYKGDGLYDKGQLTALSLPLWFGLSPESASTLDLIKKATIKNKARALFGIFGAKYTPRVLAENGEIDLALEYFIQEDYPGWGNWIKEGATALWESWEGDASKNHIMFGDVSAWIYRYLGGFRPDEDYAKDGIMTIAPVFPKKIPGFIANFHGFRTNWTRNGEKIRLEIFVPQKNKARVILSSARQEDLRSGINVFDL